MIFDEIKIDTITHNDELYVNVEQLYKHLQGAIENFSLETYKVATVFGITRDEKFFVQGLIEGMQGVAVMLKFNNQEFELQSVETVDDLLKKFWEKRDKQ